MSHFKRLLFSTLLVLSGFQLIFSRTGDGISEEDRKIKCKELNSARANFTICCQFPTLVMFRWNYNKCTASCENSEYCCVKMCTFRALDFIPTFLNAANHNPCAGLKYSFLLSVGNASQWMEPITESCSYCNNLVQKHPEETDECGVPFYLYDIINCVYSENYFRCPNYNPHQLPECDLSQQYNEICGRL